MSEQIYSAKLLTGRTIKVRVLNTMQEEVAIKALGTDANLTQATAQKGLTMEFVKMMITEVDGSPVSYQDLENLDNYFTLKEIRQLETLYQKLHLPSEDEDKDFLASISQVSMTK